MQWGLERGVQPENKCNALRSLPGVTARLTVLGGLAASYLVVYALLLQVAFHVCHPEFI